MGNRCNSGKKPENGQEAVEVRPDDEATTPNRFCCGPPSELERRQQQERATNEIEKAIMESHESCLRAHSTIEALAKEMDSQRRPSDQFGALQLGKYDSEMSLGGSMSMEMQEEILKETSSRISTIRKVTTVTRKPKK